MNFIQKNLGWEIIRGKFYYLMKGYDQGKEWKSRKNEHQISLPRNIEIKRRENFKISKINRLNIWIAHTINHDTT